MPACVSVHACVYGCVCVSCVRVCLCVRVCVMSNWANQQKHVRKGAYRMVKRRIGLLVSFRKLIICRAHLRKTTLKDESSYVSLPPWDLWLDNSAKIHICVCIYILYVHGCIMSLCVRESVSVCIHKFVCMYLYICMHA